MSPSPLRAPTSRRDGRPGSLPRSRARRPSLEPLEDRKLLTYMMINSVKVTEGNAGRVMANFSVSLNAPSAVPVTVDYATSDMTGKAGVDYDATSSTLTFEPGQTSKVISVPVIGNTVQQANRTFKVTLSNARNGTIISSAGTGTILDDDAPVTPVLSIDDPRIYEGTSGTKQVLFKVSLNVPVMDKSVTVTASTTDGTAKAGSDYTATKQVITFAPGETEKYFAVTIYGDTEAEGPEVFYAQLTGASVGVKKAAGACWLFNGNG